MKHTAQPDVPNAITPTGATPTGAAPQPEVSPDQVQQGSRIEGAPLEQVPMAQPHVGVLSDATLDALWEATPSAPRDDAPSELDAADLRDGSADATAVDLRDGSADAVAQAFSSDEHADAPSEEMSQEDAEMSENILQLASKRLRRKWIILIALLALVIVGGFAAFLILTSSTPEQAALKPDPNVQVGSVTGSTQDLEKIVDEGMLTFSINTTPSFQNGKSSGNMMIENSEINNNRFTVTIFRDDTKETIYQSGTLDPGQYINEVALDVSLEAGQYPCTARFNTYSLSDNKPIGQAAAKITIHVLS